MTLPLGPLTVTFLALTLTSTVLKSFVKNKGNHLPSDGIWRKSSVNSTLILLISSLLNNNAIEWALGNT